MRGLARPRGGALGRVRPPSARLNSRLLVKTRTTGTTLMWQFYNWSAAAFLYLGLHGTYTLLWLIKQAVFADKRFAQPIPLWIGVFTPFLPLMAYMIGP
jgi:hypothetical protein